MQNQFTVKQLKGDSIVSGPYLEAEHVCEVTRSLDNDAIYLDFSLGIELPDSPLAFILHSCDKDGLLIDSLEAIGPSTIGARVTGTRTLFKKDVIRIKIMAISPILFRGVPQIKPKESAYVDNERPVIPEPRPTSEKKKPKKRGTKK